MKKIFLIIFTLNFYCFSELNEGRILDESIVLLHENSY